MSYEKMKEAQIICAFTELSVGAETRTVFNWSVIKGPMSTDNCVNSTVNKVKEKKALMCNTCVKSSDSHVNNILQYAEQSVWSPHWSI